MVADPIASPSPFGVDSEIASLRTVVVHRPDAGIDRLDPRTKDRFLFDEVMDVGVAQGEHDGLVAELRGRGVEVLQHEQLLADALDASADASRRALETAVARDGLDAGLRASVVDELTGWKGRDLAPALISGLTLAELEGPSPGGDDARFVLPPLPNSLYQRDPAIWLYGGVAISAMSRDARRGERVNQSTIYRFHPRFADPAPPVLDLGAGDRPGGDTDSDGVEGGDGIEGGDLMVLGHGTVVAGLSERTSGAMVERLASDLFARGLAERVIAISLPNRRAAMHLDTVLTLLAPGVVTAYRPLLDDAATVSLRPGPAPGSRGGHLDRRAERSAYDAIADALGVSRLEVVPTGRDGAHGVDHEEQWLCAHNYLALEPGVVVGYALNEATNREVRRRGVEVVEIEGTELVKGHGGPHCLTAPVLRRDRREPS